MGTRRSLPGKRPKARSDLEWISPHAIRIPSHVIPRLANHARCLLAVIFRYEEKAQDDNLS